MDRSTLARALDSAAAQTYPNIEIVVAAASGSGHRIIPSTWAGRKVRFVPSSTPLGRADAGNIAIDAATGEWLNFLDDDDELSPDHVQVLLRRENGDARARVIYSRTLVVDESGGTTSFGKPHQPVDLLLRSQFCVHSAMLHRSLLHAGVRFDNSLPVHEDLDFWIQCAQETEFRFVDEFTGTWHAFVGTSGAGGGTNFDSAQTTPAQRRIQAKWSHLVPAWTQSLNLGEVVQRGQSALKAGHAALAVSLFAEAYVRAPTDVNVLNLAGVANLRAHNPTRAVELFGQAVQIFPDHPGLKANLNLAMQQSLL